MSKYMQLTVSVKPFYSASFDIAFPRLARTLASVKSNWAGKEPSLYELAGQIDTLLYQTDGTRLREILMAHKDELKKLHAQIEEQIAMRNLSRADELLYRVEDILEEIESQLG